MVVTNVTKMVKILKIQKLPFQREIIKTQINQIKWNKLVHLRRY